LDTHLLNHRAEFLEFLDTHTDSTDRLLGPASWTPTFYAEENEFLDSHLSVDQDERLRPSAPR